jgi:hypothetical protein
MMPHLPCVHTLFLANTPRQLVNNINHAASGWMR